jgi:zinc/manganese transport system ATP-binding protein
VDPLIELKHVTFGYGAQPVLEDICLHIHPGQFAALVGPSGAGKTSLLKLLLGMHTPQRGTIMIHGHTLAGQAVPHMSYVPQLETVDWTFPVTVEQVVLMGRVRRTSIWPWPSAEDRRRVRAVLERLDIGGLAKQHIRNLSGGQQQRVFLARALLAEPDLLILDEPTTGVDMRTAENVLHMLGDLNQQGMTILMTTHDLNAAAAHVPWIVCLNRRVIAQGSPDSVFTSATLNATYQSDMLVIRQDGMLFVQQKPHGHSYHACVPHPVPGEVPGREPEVQDGCIAPTISV